MIKAIIIQSKPAWYCQHCKLLSQVLYIDGDNRYCSECVSEETRKHAKYFNQNGEEIEYKEQ